MKLEGWLEEENNNLGYWFGTRGNHFTIIYELWELARRIGIFISWEVKEVHSIKKKGLGYAWCVISDWLYHWFAPQISALWILFISSLVQNRSLVCSRRWDRHARHLSLCDDPKSHFKEDCTMFFRRNKTQSIYFFVYLFLEITYLWRTLRRHARCFFKD